MFSYYVCYVGYTFKVITHNGHVFEMNITVEISMTAMLYSGNAERTNFTVKITLDP